jgi:hypothetical protein
MVELQWHGTQRIEAETMVEWAKRRTGKGLPPVVALRHKVYQKGMALGKAAMQAVEKRLERPPAWPKYDILINPAPTSCIRKFGSFQIPVDSFNEPLAVVRWRSQP